MSNQSRNIISQRILEKLSYDSFKEVFEYEGENLISFQEENPGRSIRAFNHTETNIGVIIEFKDEYITGILFTHPDSNQSLFFCVPENIENILYADIIERIDSIALYFPKLAENLIIDAYFSIREELIALSEDEEFLFSFTKGIIPRFESTFEDNALI